jgi:TRAP-type C4-dicarboxylate transport system permease small subunit
LEKTLERPAPGAEKVIDFINKICVAIGGATVGLLVIVAFAGTMLRYIFHSPFIFADEWGGYLMVIMSFIGLTYTMRQGGHSVVDFAIKKVPEKFVRWIKLANEFFNLAFVIFLLVPTISFVGQSFTTGARSNTELATPLAAIQIVMPFGLGLLCIALLLEIRKKLTHRPAK